MAQRQGGGWLATWSVFFFGSIILNVPGTEALKFIGKLDHFATAYLSFSMDFNCTTDDPAATVALLHSQGIGALTERSLSPNKLILDGQVFTVLNLAVNDAGRYACRATDQSGISITSSELHRILQRATLPREFGLLPNKALTIMQGHSASIVCYGSPQKLPFSLTWEKQTNGSYVSVDQSMLKRDQSNQRVAAILTIANAKSSDSGIYKCTVAVEHLSTFRLTSVQVKAPSSPTIIEPTTRDRVIMEGQEQTIKCDAEGAPKPVVTWYKNGQQLKKTQCFKGPDSCQDIYEVFEAGETSPNFTSSTYGRLKIVSALYTRDQGEFKCVASNGNLPKAELIFNLDVTVKPHLRKELDDKVRYVNENLKTQVSCKVVKSNPLPTFSWFYQNFICDKSHVQECVPDERKWKPVPPEKIHNASIPSFESFVDIDSDQGNSYYQCKASSSLGNDSLVIIFKRAASEKPKVEVDRTITKTKYNEKSTLKIYCFDRCGGICGNYFSKDGKFLSHADDPRVNITSDHDEFGGQKGVLLTITNMTMNDSGQYECGLLVPRYFARINITVKGTEALKFIGQLDPYGTAYLGFSMEFNCTTDDPAATVALLHSQGFGALTERSLSPNKLILDGQVFTVLNLAVPDAGRYACRATDQSGTSITSSQLYRVLHRAKLPREFGLVPKKALTIMQGHSASIVCYASFETFPFSLTWEKQTTFGSYVSVDPSMVKRDQSNQLVRAILTVANAKLSDSGIYKCTVAVKHVSTFKVTAVQVKAPLAPRISKPTTRDRVVMEGQEQTVECDAEGAPKPVVTWYKNGQQLKKTQCTKDPDSCQDIVYEVFEVGETSPNFTSSTYGRLKVVSALYQRDQGEFKCVASNGNLPPAELIFNLDVTVKPHLRKELDDKVRYVNENLKTQVSCQVVKSNPLPTFSWFYQIFICDKLNLQECVPDERRWKPVPLNKIFPNASIPSLKSFVNIDSDQGNSYYQCKASSSLGSDSLVIIFKRSVLGNDELIKVIAGSEKYDEGQTLQLQCIITRKVSVVSWFKDNKQLNADSGGRITVLSTKLSVKGLMANDSGLYTCLAKDSSGQNLNGSLFITIKKTYSPTILYFNNETAYHQTTVKLFCNVSGYPIPKINWFKDNVPLGNRIEEENKLESCEGFVEGFTYQINDPFYVGLLVICHPSHAQHSGFYTCQASNQAGGTNATAFLNVLEDSVIVSPREELRRQPVQVNLGEPWNATCKATGNPAPRMEWRKQYSSQTLPTTQHGSKGVVLKIEALAEKDLGIYLCLAENGLGKDNASIELVLAANPELLVVSHSVLFRKDAIIVILVVAVAVFCLLVLSISLFVCIRRQKKILIKYRNELFPKYCGEPQLDPDRSIFEQYNSLPYDPMWEFPEDRLSLGETLGSGLFGQVIKAEAMGITEFNPRNKRREKVQRRSNSFRRYGSSRRYVELPKTTVAVKTLKANATLEEYRDLASELKILIHIGEHKNIVNLLGACTKGNRLLVIMEYAPHGNLGDFLRSRRHIFEPVWGRSAVLDPELDLNISHLVNFSYEVCRGMEFLASKKCIHRDLAARNVLVGEEYVMKIADFGLARDIHATNEYVKTTDGVFPAKWMALESLFSKVYSEKSDVWSFGICLWEIFTLGGSPYHMIVTECLLDFLSEGNRMESPQDCPDEFYAVMNDCWRKEAKDRPSFAELSERIGEIIERHASEQGYPAYIIFTGDNRGNQSDYVNPVECDTSASQHGAAAGYSRVLSGETTHCSLLSSVVENDCNPEADEREQMLVAEASGSLSGNESGIDVEENGNDMATIAMEMRPLKSANEKRRKKQNSQQSFA